jgi:hypothetical protein
MEDISLCKTPAALVGYVQAPDAEQAVQGSDRAVWHQQPAHSIALSGQILQSRIEAR